MKVILGTANFGKAYGFRQIKADKVDDILRAALDLGIETIETAYDYQCLKQLRKYRNKFNFFCKCDSNSQKEEMNDKLMDDRYLTFIKHHPPYLGRWDGVSLYDVYGKYKDFRFFSDDKNIKVEIPYNIVDQRFRNIKFDYRYVMARSVFMQGLAFQVPDIDGIPFYHLCWNFVVNDENINAIVVGVDNYKQLEDLFKIPSYEIDYSKIGTGDKWIK
jgi:hypothetical protein